MLEVVLLDILNRDDFRKRPVGMVDSLIILHVRTPEDAVYLRQVQIDSELRGKSEKQIPDDCSLDLIERNGTSGLWEGFRPVSKRLIILDLDDYYLGMRRLPEGRPALFDRYPQTAAWVKAWRPGYSRDGQTAVARFWIGPSPHGAAGTYLLTLEQGHWQIKWRNIAYFA